MPLQKNNDTKCNRDSIDLPPDFDYSFERNLLCDNRNYHIFSNSKWSLLRCKIKVKRYL